MAEILRATGVDEGDLRIVTELYWHQTAQVEESWKTLEFCVIPHKDAKDVYILGSLEDIQTALDESNINITTIASSRHVGPIKSRVEEWQRNLDLFFRTLDEWMNCQQSWIYLEVIFSAPDIQRQLPNEAKLFVIVDKSWKDVMRRTAKSLNTTPTCSLPSNPSKMNGTRSGIASTVAVLHPGSEAELLDVQQ
ncbi:dynein heavy chain 6, axonemal-like [Sitophilus oryzae]|uniref:Dynein heavy chain 6, axonemal-like n=1 Tax=Sitophilus oryzae TaxID=7048 RepID=A0A6J2XJF5_SITOR|nr:dynein heavy chain 6, axonemal-like [Sitophilus oryzae]